MSSRMKLVIAYHGSPFHGWQRQRGQQTVQGEIETALGKVLGGHRITIHGAGRTDAGVHAVGQVAHCDLPVEIPPSGLFRGLCGVLHEGIRIRSIHRVGLNFHARRSALGKLYTYRARWHQRTLPWLDIRSAHLPEITRPAEMAAAASLLLGTHDWASFSVPDLPLKSTIRTIYRVDLRHLRDGIDFDFIGSGFLRYQVRRMVGALLEVGRGRRTIDEIRSLLEEPEPGASVTTAPAAGLSLEHIYYQKAAALTDPS